MDLYIRIPTEISKIFDIMESTLNYFRLSRENWSNEQNVLKRL